MLQYILEVCKTNRWYLKRVNAHIDHVHMLIELGASDSVAGAVQKIKGATSAAFNGDPHFPMFTGWNKGYCAFSVGYREVPIVTEYIKNQDIHHQAVTTGSEFSRLLHEHGMQEGDFEDF